MSVRIMDLSPDRVVVAFSGGKDSVAMTLDLLDQGVPKDRIELHHHLVDGLDHNGLMDWPITAAYCEETAKALGLPLYFSWRRGGFEAEMDRADSPTGMVEWECPDGTFGNSGGYGPRNTRGKFPQVSADLRVRWCSA